MARLIVKFGTQVERVLELDVKELLVGRGSDCQLELEHDLVSRHHCKLRLAGDGFVVEDMQSTTGTFVNRVRVRAHILNPAVRSNIRGGDMTKLGSYIGRSAGGQSYRESLQDLLNDGIISSEVYTSPMANLPVSN